MLAPIVAIGVTMAIVPVIGAVALAADPTIIVRPGDTLTAISQRSGVPIVRLVELNDLRDPDHILVGERLRIGVESKKPAPAATTPTGTALTHVVKRGEILWGIAKHYGVSVSALAGANGIADPSRIFGGQRLTVPGATTSTEPATSSSAPKRAMPAGMAELVAARDDVRRVIIEEADRHGVPRAFALAVAWQESGWRQGVVSYAGAVGVMQLLPTTADWVSATMLGSPVDIHATRDNVRAGVRLLAHYLDRYDGNRDLVLAAYYQGQTAADRHGVYGITRPYIASIQALEAMFGG
jgi:LysM repeat protein